MSLKWFFQEFMPGDTEHGSKYTQALFSNDSSKEGDSPLARSLVRESIQNSMDARVQGPESTGVTVRYRLGKNDQGLKGSQAKDFTTGLWQHLSSPESGLNLPPDQAQPIPYLVVEDFGTQGLTGDPGEWRPNEGSKNAFYLFFRALGRSGKSDSSGGRWGIGKFVFPMCSDAHLIWGFTVPFESKSPLLMGRALLNTHKVLGTSFHSDGYWGEKLGETGLVTPVSSDLVIDTFIRAFEVSRLREPGLSVVIPWVASEITFDNIRSSVIEEYFLPLLKGELRVDIDDGERSCAIEPDEVVRYGKDAGERIVRERILLGQDISAGNIEKFIWPVTFNRKGSQWNAGDLDEQYLQSLKNALLVGKAVSVTLFVDVKQKKSAEILNGSLTVNLRRVEGLGSERPLIVRDGISISEDRTKRLNDHVAILTADRCPMATLIGDAETPAHESLQHESIKHKYLYPKKMIEFVRDAAANLLRVVYHVDQENDPFALANYFPQMSENGTPGPKAKVSVDGEEPEPVPIIPHSRKRFKVSRIDGGLRVQGNSDSPNVPDELHIAVAYDVRRGDPFKRHRFLDFSLADEPMRVSVSNASVDHSASNQLIVRPSTSEYCVDVVGFDPRRDVIVNVSVSGSGA